SPTPDSWRAVTVGRLLADGGTLQVVVDKAVDPVPTATGQPTPEPTMWGRMRYVNRLHTVSLTSYGFFPPPAGATHDAQGCGVVYVIGQHCGFDDLQIDGFVATATIDAAGNNLATLVDFNGTRQVGAKVVLTSPARV